MIYIRVIDFVISVILLFILFPVILVVFIVCYLDTGKPILVQRRIGKGCKEFSLYKFRSMSVEAKSLPTHLVDASLITTWGAVIRGLKLDELPQIVNVLIGDMSFVGPRPCLPCQDEVIFERLAKGIFNVKPGLTGLSQILKIDMSTPVLLAETDLRMINNFSLCLYIEIFFVTLCGKGFGDRIKKG